MFFSLKNKFIFLILGVIFIVFTQPKANGNQVYKEINKLINSCYQDISLCNKALIKINNYQRNSAINKNFSCQTRLLGLEANVIMSMDSNFKKKEAKSIIDSVKKYC
tara:strand:- start:67 stop:387 length:321 start_codon:yes stop_codon:yes gene_type:complete